MNPEDLKTVLKRRGWRVEDPREKGVAVTMQHGLFKCVDGRQSELSKKQDGPKALGGVFALACMLNARTEDKLGDMIEMVKTAGYVPSVHGDAHGPMGCGFFKLWKTGQLPGRRPPEYDGMTARRKVLEKGGVYEWLNGHHDESYTIINLKSDTTFAPAQEQRFVLDAWVIEKFKDETGNPIDIGEYATLAAITVEKLRPAAMVAHIVV